MPCLVINFFIFFQSIVSFYVIYWSIPSFLKGTILQFIITLAPTTRYEQASIPYSTLTIPFLHRSIESLGIPVSSTKSVKEQTGMNQPAHEICIFFFLTSKLEWRTLSFKCIIRKQNTTYLSVHSSKKKQKKNNRLIMVCLPHHPTIRWRKMTHLNLYGLIF